MRMSKLIGRMAEKNISSKEMAKCLGISKNTMTSRILGRSEFKQSEIEKACILLEIDNAEDKCEIFLPYASHKMG